MAFVVPNFNLLCNVGTSGDAAYPPTAFAFSLRDADVPCALVYGRRVNVSASGGTGTQGFPIETMNLLLPIGQDIRGPQDSTGLLDAVEVPAGSGRFYVVIFVDDIGKGYANEHRTAGIAALPLSWVAPYP